MLIQLEFASVTSGSHLQLRDNWLLRTHEFPRIRLLKTGLVDLGNVCAHSITLILINA
jgi:hypothetical protein